MKETPMKKCPKPPPAPKPNLKNKEFVKWSRAENCKKEDNIISTDWHERLKKTSPFNPAYDNAPLNMVYLLSGEYGRIWQKERDDWYTGVFTLNKKDKEMDDRKKKIRKAAREAKKAAEINIRERKERREREAEAKAKAEAEKAEKIKAKLAKCAAKAKPKKKQGKSKAPPPPPPQEEEESGQGTCPKGWQAVELTMQCECSNHKNEAECEKKETEKEVEACRTPKGESPQICNNYYQQLQDIQTAKNNEIFDNSKTEAEHTMECCKKEMPAEKATSYRKMPLLF